MLKDKVIKPLLVATERVVEYYFPEEKKDEKGPKQKGGSEDTEMRQAEAIAEISTAGLERSNQKPSLPNTSANDD